MPQSASAPVAGVCHLRYERGVTRRSTYFFDGGSRPNPGPVEVAVVSRGLAHFRDDVGSGDNSQAEWSALLFAAEIAVAQGASNVLFVGDSSLVVHQASGAWPCRSVQLQSYHAALQDLIAPLEKVAFRHVARSKNLAGIALARRHLPDWSGTNHADRTAAIPASDRR
ncbi:ribonuclease HI family protein [Novosphingobium sp. RD2P27]|uniref:Ribonuclease HI family protein n=1 Tax=Novosphingobium kalidii TaxID=3230299 RepID=A0ABV2CZ09_9SPHN